MTKLKYFIRPLSINEAWQGRRFKSKKYKAYERELLLALPAGKMIKGFVGIEIEFYFKNFGCRDVDNPVKPLLDILQKKGYFENDKKIIWLKVEKFKSKKEGFLVKIYKKLYGNAEYQN